MKQVDFSSDFLNVPKSSSPLWIDERLSWVALPYSGPFVRTQDQAILCIATPKGGQTQVCRSYDEGLTWHESPMFGEEQGFGCFRDHALLVSASGRVYLSFLNTADIHFNWIKHRNLPSKNTRLYQWVVWSDDHGATWHAPVLIQQGYAASVRSLIELADGTLVVSAQNLDYQVGRHYALTFVSKDSGVTWQGSNRIDMPGRGHHDGCFEGCLLALSDDKLWYMIRTNQDWFWNAYSYDQGLSWVTLSPGFPASSSPGMLKTLASGRIMMVYNPLNPVLSDLLDTPRRAGQFSTRAASWWRDELVVRFSQDNGLSWSDPQVLACMEKAWLSYPQVFEVAKGRIWLTTIQTGLKLAFNESDLL